MISSFFQLCYFLILELALLQGFIMVTDEIRRSSTSPGRYTGCPRKFVPRLPEDHDKAAKGRHHILA